jgi:hypothetical protein
MIEVMRIIEKIRNDALALLMYCSTEAAIEAPLIERISSAKYAL